MHKWHNMHNNDKEDSMIHELFTKPTLIFGCGNTLFGDDGFGPETIEYLLSNYSLPDSVAAVDVGTSIGDLLFDLALSPARPDRIFIVDAVSQPGRGPGEIFELEIEKLPANKSGDFTLHQFPSVNLLEEMRSLAGVDVRIIAVQIKCIPDAVQPGLSPEVRAAIPPTCEWLLECIGERAGGSGSSVCRSDAFG